MENSIDTQPKRLRILSDEEIEAIYGIPRFTHEERIEYFSLSPIEKAALEQLHSIKSRIYFILQLGYFKARHLFVAFSIREIFEDARYIQEQYFPDFQLSEFKITNVTRLNQQNMILSLRNYRSCGAQERRKLETKAKQAAVICSKPISRPFQTRGQTFFVSESQPSSGSLVRLYGSVHHEFCLRFRMVLISSDLAP
jgi:hypothetical protein